MERSGSSTPKTGTPETGTPEADGLTRGQSSGVAAKGKNALGPKAVAVSSVRGQDRAPRVIAKGRGDLARHILDLAAAHGLPVRKDGDLVEVLEAVEVDEAIPLEAYALIAEILAYVYMANNGAPADNWTPIAR